MHRDVSINSVTEQSTVICNPLCLGRRDSETPDIIDINGENTIIWFDADAGQNEQLMPEKKFKQGV